MDSPSARVDVRSRDGTSIAVWVEGRGPALVMVHGSMNDHATAFPSLQAELRPFLTLYSIDRRGFGASGDSTPYAIEREFEDVGAVVDAIATRTGLPVALWGHSYGASCAMGGAALTSNVHRLILYEPSLGLTYPAASLERIEHLLAEGDYEGALVAVYAEILEMTEDEIRAVRARPDWDTKVATAHTILREADVEQRWSHRQGYFGGIDVPALLLSGSASPSDLHEATRRAAAALASAEVRVLEGHGHMAHKTDPAMVAGIILDFLEA